MPETADHVRFERCTSWPATRPVQVSPLLLDHLIIFILLSGTLRLFAPARLLPFLIISPWRRSATSCPESPLPPMAGKSVPLRTITLLARSHSTLMARVL